MRLFDGLRALRTGYPSPERRVGERYVVYRLVGWALGLRVERISYGRHSTARFLTPQYLAASAKIAAGAALLREMQERDFVQLPFGQCWTDAQLELRGSVVHFYQAYSVLGDARRAVAEADRYDQLCW